MHRWRLTRRFQHLTVTVAMRGGSNFALVTAVECHGESRWPAYALDETSARQCNSSIATQDVIATLTCEGRTNDEGPL